jgi:hypothetical protein
MPHTPPFCCRGNGLDAPLEDERKRLRLEFDIPFKFTPPMEIPNVSHSPIVLKGYKDGQWTKKEHTSTQSRFQNGNNRNIKRGALCTKVSLLGIDSTIMRQAGDTSCSKIGMVPEATSAAIDWVTIPHEHAEKGQAV